jgi:small GTP-binding protein
MPSLERNLTVLGSPSVGKSKLTLRFVRDEFTDEYLPTMLKKYFLQMRNANNQQDYDLTILDTAGLEPQSDIATTYINSHGFVLVYSIVDYNSFDTVKKIYIKLMDELNGENKPVILIGNKSDLVEKGFDCKREVSIDDGRSLAKQMNASFIETSARKGENVRDVFETLLCRIDPPTTQDLTNHQGSNGSHANSSSNTSRQQPQPNPNQLNTTNPKNNKNSNNNTCTIS